ncbi:unnamed protein product, partial [Polarella glacialis]
MESADTDGASEASYESVASEGGYEPASDRGRDPLPRIISASHCVQVFGRLCNVADGAYCSKDPAYAVNSRAKGKAAARPGRHDPLEGMPPRILRFEGAMEAWLEEMPLTKVPSGTARQYMTLHDASGRKSPGVDLSLLRAGNQRGTIWYFTQEFLQQLWPCFLLSDGTGVQIWERALLERNCTIQSTHVEVGQVNVPSSKEKSRSEWLKALFASMQAAKWTPDGEARSILAKRRLT